MQASELFKQSNTVLLDGGMGTMLQTSGLKLGAKPEELNITNPELIESIHAKYAAAGSRIVNANTFGASAHKLAGSAYSLEEIIAAGIANCKRACAPYGALTALDVGPLGAHRPGRRCRRGRPYFLRDLYRPLRAESRSAGRKGKQHPAHSGQHEL